MLLLYSMYSFYFTFLDSVKAISLLRAHRLLSESTLFLCTLKNSPGGSKRRARGRVDFAKKHRGASLERSFAALRQRLRGETMKRNLMILPMKTEESNLGFNILLPFFSPLR
jgi:hypothetical protein